MFITKLRIQNFRSLKNTTLEPGRHLNFITGHNGAGKTSVIEALFFLSQGKSFKVQTPRSMIRDGEVGFSIGAEIIDDAGNANYASVYLDKDGRSITFNNESNVSVLKVCNAIPVQIVAPDTIDLLLEGPEVRRSYLNWGMFYVHPQFVSIYNEFQRYHKQRLSVLMKCKSVIDSGRMVSDELQATLALYTKRVAQLTDQLLEMYNSYTNELIPVLKQVLEDFLPELKFEIRFYQGWNERISSLENLEQNLARDMTNGRCYTGLHRFDFVIKCFGEPVQNVLSRGQLKLLACAMKLAQGENLSDKVKNSCVYLVDDLAAELDSEKQLRFARRLIRENNQIFMSYINAKDLEIYRALVKDWHEFKIINGDVQHQSSDGKLLPKAQSYKNYLNLIGQIEWSELSNEDFEAKIKELQDWGNNSSLDNSELVSHAQNVLQIDKNNNINKELEDNIVEVTEAYLTELEMWGDDSLVAELPSSKSDKNRDFDKKDDDLNKIKTEEVQEVADSPGTACNEIQVNKNVDTVAQELIDSASSSVNNQQDLKVADKPDYEVDEIGVKAVKKKILEMEIPNDWKGEEEFQKRKSSSDSAILNKSLSLDNMMSQYIVGNADINTKSIIETDVNSKHNELWNLKTDSDSIREEPFLIKNSLENNELDIQENFDNFDSFSTELFKELDITNLDQDLESIDSFTKVKIEKEDTNVSKPSGNLFTIMEEVIEQNQDGASTQIFKEENLHDKIEEKSSITYLHSNLEDQGITTSSCIEARDLTAFFEDAQIAIINQDNVNSKLSKSENIEEAGEELSGLTLFDDAASSSNLDIETIDSDVCLKERARDELIQEQEVMNEALAPEFTSKPKRTVRFWVKRKSKS